MNKKQKTALLTGLIIVVAALLFWLTSGAEIFQPTVIYQAI